MVSNEKKQAAYRLYNAALRRGDLVRPDKCSRCERPDQKAETGRHTIQGHHADYDKPLDVEWLCPRCHRVETPLPDVMGAPVFGSSNGASRLTEDQAHEIRTSHLNGADLAKKFGVTRSAVNRIRCGENRKLLDRSGNVWRLERPAKVHETVPLSERQPPMTRNADKTHCKHGHPFTVENTIIKNGYRECRACANLQAAKWRARQKASASPAKGGA